MKSRTAPTASDSNRHLLHWNQRDPKELDGHLYVMARHAFETDPDPQPSKHPHVHLVVKVRSDEGKRLNPRKDDLQRWRETYAQALRDHGIDAAATRRLQRFKLERAEKQAVRQIRDSGRKLERIGKSKADPERVQHAKRLERKAIEVYRQLCTAPGSSDDVDDRRLALSLLNRLAEDRGIAVPLQKVERQAKRDRERPQR